MDDQALHAHGGWPLPVSLHARLIGELALAGVAGVLYNVIFAGPYSSADIQAFDDAVSRLPIAVFPIIEGLPPHHLTNPRAVHGELALAANENGVVVEAQLLGERLGSPTIVALSACAVYRIQPCAFRSRTVALRDPPAGIPRLRLDEGLAAQRNAALFRNRFAIVHYRFYSMGTRHTSWGKDVSEAELLAAAIVAAAAERLGR